MHNSQNGSAVAKDDSGIATATPHDALLIYSCLGCHTSTGNTTWRDPYTKAPIVLNTGGTNYGFNHEGLAAGNFYNVAATDNTGHNVLSSNPDGILGNTPPGGSDLGGQIKCATSKGCHGNRGADVTEIEDLKGAHHTTGGTIDGTTVGRSYRFLKGITGVEDNDWENTFSSSDHNKYRGSTTFTDGDTISFLCGKCHGKFHSNSEVGTVSPWLRHPTDIELFAKGGEFTAYDTVDNYRIEAPVAWTNPASPTKETSVVMCLSCHRAHASPYFKMVRWDIKSGTLSTALSGCNVCHTSKN